MIGLHAVQVAVVALLKAADVAGGKIMTEIPDNTPGPYVEVGEIQMIQTDPQGSAGGDEFIDLHVWSTKPQWKQVLDIADQIHTVLNGVTLDVPGRTSAYAEIDGVKTLVDGDGRTRRVIVTVKIMHFGPA